MEPMVFHIFVVLFTFHSVSGVNQIYISGTSGPDVVEATVNVIRESCIFPSDHLFLRRLAYVESRDGLYPKTYRNSYYGGIWQVDETLFHATQSSDAKFTPIYAAIKNRFQIDWMTVVWSDLTKPLYSGLAAYIYTFSVSDSNGIPRRIEEQGVFWTSKFHQVGTAHNFTILAGLLAKVCHGNEHQDIVFVLDSSASLSAADFTQTKSFVENVISLFTIDATKTRVAVVVYSSHSTVAFNLNTHTTKASLTAAAQGIPYIAGGTNTPEALNMAVNDVLFGPEGNRHDAAKIIILVTDGKSNDEIVTGQAAAHARSNGVVVFAIGVGTKVSIPELNLVATDPDCTHVFTVSGYNDIIDIKEEIEKSSCTAPLMTLTGLTCLLGECPHLAFHVPKEGLTVYTNTTCPTATMYAAFNNPLPNGAYYEFIGQVSATQASAVFVNSIGDAFPLYVTIHATQSTAGNCYVTIIPIPGHLDHTKEILCKQDGVERLCNSSDLYKNPLCEELWLFTNPCTDNAINQNELCYPYPYDHTKYILCTLNKKAFIEQCPKGEAYVDASHKCVGANSETTLRCGYQNTSLDALYCTIENHFAKKFYFTYPPDIKKFIQCDNFGKAFIKDCQPDLVWDQTDLQCIRSRVLGSPIGLKVPNPCIRGLVHPRDMFHPYPLDPHSYIECDEWGQAFKMACPVPEVWNDVLLECDGVTVSIIG